MRWRRRRDAGPDGATSAIESTESNAGSSTTASASSEIDAPTSSMADESVLDELSRVFAVGEVLVHDPAPRDPVDDDGDGDDDGDVGSEDVDVPDASTSVRAPIAIGGDDLPDAVYLDDELVREESGSGPVFIDDDGSSDAVMPKDASTRGIEPRIRQRRIGVNRAANRKRLWWISVAAVVLVVVVAVLAVLGSSLFAVENVQVTGNVYTDPTQLAAVVDDLKGTPVLRVDRAEIEAAVEAIPWVDEARVDTDFPNAASIEIRERTPVAAMPGADGEVRVLDADGRVLGLVDGQPVALVWIAGPGTLDLAPGQFAPGAYTAATSFVTKLTPDIRARVDSLLVTPDGSDLVLMLTSDGGPIQVRFGSAIGENAQIEKLVRLEQTLGDLGDKPVTAIDVSTSEVTVR